MVYSGILTDKTDDNQEKQIEKIKNLMKDIEEIKEEVDIEESVRISNEPARKLKTFK